LYCVTSSRSRRRRTRRGSTINQLTSGLAVCTNCAALHRRSAWGEFLHIFCVFSCSGSFLIVKNHTSVPLTPILKHQADTRDTTHPSGRISPYLVENLHATIQNFQQSSDRCRLHQLSFRCSSSPCASSPFSRYLPSSIIPARLSSVPPQMRISIYERSHPSITSCCVNTKLCILLIVISFI
jgi:hypothetical protein